MILDYTITSLDERKKYVENIVNTIPEHELNLDQLADYLILCMEKEERKTKTILTDNRSVTINKRETSFEGLVDKIEGGENTLYHMIKEDKNMLLQPKKLLTATKIAEYPELTQVKNAIDEIKKNIEKHEGLSKYILKKTSIKLYQDLYMIYEALTKPAKIMKITASDHTLDLGGLTFSDPDVVSAALCNYSRLKEDSYDNFNSDTKWMMEDLDNLLEITLKDKPNYERIVILKIDGLSNAAIQEIIQKEFGLAYTKEYISTLWRKRIPSLIAKESQRQWMDWMFGYILKIPKKKCTRCGKKKFATSFYFSKDSSKADGLYTICKECRNASHRKEQQ